MAECPGDDIIAAFDRTGNVLVTAENTGDIAGNRWFFCQYELFHIYILLSDIEKPRKHDVSEVISEAPTRFELVIEVLQTFALPLGYGAMPYVLLSITNT